MDGFWSVSVYNAQGYYEPNALNAYTLNNITGKRARMDPLRYSLVTAMERLRTVCRLHPDGTTWFDCIVRGRKS